MSGVSFPKSMNYKWRRDVYPTLRTRFRIVNKLINFRTSYESVAKVFSSYRVRIISQK